MVLRGNSHRKCGRLRHSRPAAPKQTAMIDLAVFREEIARWSLADADSVEVLIQTQCLYPSNGFVKVAIEGGATTWRVHDCRGALDEYMAIGSVTPPNLGAARHIARRQGLSIDVAGRVVAPLVSADRLISAIIMTANVSKEIAHHFVERFRPEFHRDLRSVLEELLERRFPHEMRREETVVGHSNKQHKFDFSVRLPHEKRLLLDAVTPEASSINAAVVAHLDVAAANLPGVFQRLVYDEDARWKSSDLALLTVGAKVVSLKRLPAVLEQMHEAA